MNYNFTKRVRKVLAMAREESIRLGHNYVGAEHILLGLVREGEGVGAAVLTDLSVDLEQVRELIEQSVPRGRGTIALGALPYSRGAKKVLEFAMAEARELKHELVGTAHLLLGLLREEKGIVGLLRHEDSLAIEALNGLGVNLDDVRTAVAKLAGAEDNTMTAASDWGSAEATPLSSAERRQILEGLLHTITLTAFRLGGSPAELRAALERAIRGFTDNGRGAD